MLLKLSLLFNKGTYANKEKNCPTRNELTTYVIDKKRDG
jgi:hypothetical protein